MAQSSECRQKFHREQHNESVKRNPCIVDVKFLAANEMWLHVRMRGMCYCTKDEDLDLTRELGVERRVLHEALIRAGSSFETCRRSQPRTG